MLRIIKPTLSDHAIAKRVFVFTLVNLFRIYFLVDIYLLFSRAKQFDSVAITLVLLPIGSMMLISILVEDEMVPAPCILSLGLFEKYLYVSNLKWNRRE